jgi:sugar porter (SP) family MFS transporter
MSTTSPTTPIHWLRTPSLRNLNFLLLSCYFGAISNGYISTLISALLSNPQWHASMHFSSVSLGLLTSAHSIGCIAAFFPAPWISEKFGRRRAIQLGNMGMLAGFAGQVFSKGFNQFLGFRIMVGFASMFNTISSAALLVELAHPRQRAIAGALFNTCFFIGSISCAWSSYGALNVSGPWSWKIPVAFQAFWAVGQIALIYFCPESPTWLIRHGQFSTAKATLVKYHADGNQSDPVVQASFSQLLTAARQNTLIRWSDLYSTPGNRRRLFLSITIGIATQWVGNGIISFYLSPILLSVGISSPLTQQSINGSLQIFTWVIAIIAALLSERAGRRKLFLTSTSTMLLFMVLVTACSAVYTRTGNRAAGYAVIIFLFLFFGGYVIGLTPIPILYVNEIWPGHLRTKGTAVFWVTQASAICFNQFVNPLALDRIAWRYYLVYVGVLVGVLVFMWFGVPETKGLTLEEIKCLFDRRADDEGDVALTGVAVTDVALTDIVTERRDGVEEVRV